MKWNKPLVFLTFLLIVFAGLIPNVGAAERTWFEDDYPGTSWDTEKYRLKLGNSPTVSGGVLNVTNGCLATLYFFSFHNLTFYICQPGYSTQGKYVNFISLNDSAKLTIRWLTSGVIQYDVKEESGTGSWTNGGINVGTTWNKITVISEEGRTRFFINGTLDKTLNHDMGNGPHYFQYDVKSGADDTLLIDWIYISEDWEACWPAPTYSYCSVGDAAVLNEHTWYPSNLTLHLDINRAGSWTAGIYIPEAYRSYFCEVKEDGSPTTSVSFIRSRRELRVAVTGDSLISVALIDPPEWMVNFAYWFMAATGVSLAPLLKIWDRLARRHKALPYIVTLMGLVFLVVGMWYGFQYVIELGRGVHV